VDLLTTLKVSQPCPGIPVSNGEPPVAVRASEPSFGIRSGISRRFVVVEVSLDFPRDSRSLAVGADNEFVGLAIGFVVKARLTSTVTTMAILQDKRIMVVVRGKYRVLATRVIELVYPSTHFILI
jgi:hypothetical protein